MNTTKKVLILADGLPAGGLERQLVELLRGLQSEVMISTIVGVLSSGGKREAEAFEAADHVLDNLKATNAGFQLLLRFPLIVLSVVRACYSVRPDIIHTFGSFSDIAGVVVAKLFKVPLVNGSIRAARPTLNYRDRITRMTLPFAARVVANSHAGLQAFGLSLNQRNRVIHNGVSLERFNGVQPQQFSAFPVLCMVGNFTSKKDQRCLVECVPTIRHYYSELQLILVGRGPNVQAIQDAAASLECSESVLVISDCDSPETYIAAADICLLFSNLQNHGEGISNSIIEYMGLRKPVIASRCGGNSELVDHGRTGYLIEQNTRQQIVQAILDILSDEQAAQEMGRRGREVIEQKFTLSAMIASYTALYNELADCITEPGTH